MKFFKYILLFSLTIYGFISFATHNRAGEIQLIPVDGSCTKFKAIVITYTKESSPADRPELTIDWGDGDTSEIPRINGNGNGVSIGGDIKYNVYEGTHTYIGGGAVYTVSIEDPNRNANVINITNSVQTPFYIFSKVFINSFLGGCNSNPVLLNPPIDDACACKKYIHNPGATDPDGDSLSYELVNCKGEAGVDIPGYSIPSGIDIDPVTGDFTWNCPNPQGEFNFAILVHEWRRFGNQVYEVGQVLRDMQITVGPCNNNPPVLQPIPDLCVTAGTVINFQVSASDQDNDMITLSATGSPLLQTVSPATFQGATGAGVVFADFNWATQCDHVKSAPYYMFFKATDNGTPTPLVDYKTVTIKVVGPKPLNVNAQPQGTKMIITWNPSVCSQVTGYKVYRKIGCNNLQPADCETGMPSSWGYTLIGTTTGLNATTYTDNNGGSGLTPGISYSYRVVAKFPDGVDSYVSDEDCAQLVRDIGVLTHVSVLKTDAVNGIDSIAWTKPIGDVNNLDTNSNPGPYEYRLYRANDIQGTGTYTLIKTFTSPTFYGLTARAWVDSSANTLDHGNNYKLEFYSNSELIGFSKASSVFLTLTPNDNQLKLTWEHYVPWINYTYHIYRKVPGATNYQFLTTTTALEYTDLNLSNGSDYCYYVKSEGSYSTSGMPSPLLNNSQETCKAPYDNTPPCAPTVSIEGDCETFSISLKWNNPNNKCADDVIQYKVYGTGWEDTTTYSLIYTINSQSDTTLVIDSLIDNMAGCYYLTALDSNANESIKGTPFCIDNCPRYELPNVFTPDKNTINDFFEPLPGWRFIKDIDLKIYDRWGTLVFKTTDPAIMWDGTNMQSKKPGSDGVYYYVCVVNEKHLGGIQSRKLSGFIHMFMDAKGGD